MTWWWHLLALLLAIALGLTTRGLWLPAIGRSLVCTGEVAPSDAILVENFNSDYELFQQAAALQRTGVAARVLVPTQASEGSDGANPISKAIAELMARNARVQNVQIVPIQQIEPYALNAAYQVRDFLATEGVRSVVVVAPAFRSRRAAFVYGAVLRPAGLHVSCLPVFVGTHTLENWATTWHGLEVVGEQFIKLQFYRFYVLRATTPSPPSRPDRPGRHSARVGHSGDFVAGEEFAVARLLRNTKRSPLPS